LRGSGLTSGETVILAAVLIGVGTLAAVTLIAVGIPLLIFKKRS